MNSTTMTSYPEWNAQGFVHPLTGVNLVWIEAPRGVLMCGAFDVQALARFDLAAARVRRPDGQPIQTADDLLQGEVLVCNERAEKAGLHPGMPAREAMALLAG